MLKKIKPPNVLIILAILAITTGCIEAGGVRPLEVTMPPLPTLMAKETPGAPLSILAFAIPDQELPDEWIKTREVSESSGGLSRLEQTMSPRTLGTTVVKWETYRDPYKTKFKEILAEENFKTVRLTPETGKEIEVVTIEEEGLYQIATHLGLYTFVASTSTPENIDALEIFGTHPEVITNIFLTGINQANQYDLETL